jgi:hypothetical protein
MALSKALLLAKKSLTIIQNRPLGSFVIINLMEQSKHKLSGLLALASLAGLAILMSSTSPIDNIIYAALFFFLALIFLISLGLFAVRLQTGEISAKNRYRVISVSLVLLILLMFRTAQSLSWVDGIILILIGFGLVFYISKRST